MTIRQIFFKIFNDTRKLLNISKLNEFWNQHVKIYKVGYKSRRLWINKFEPKLCYVQSPIHQTSTETYSTSIFIHFNSVSTCIMKHIKQFSYFVTTSNPEIVVKACNDKNFNSATTMTSLMLFYWGSVSYPLIYVSSIVNGHFQIAISVISRK